MNRRGKKGRIAILEAVLVFLFLVILSTNCQERENDSIFSLGLAPGISIPLAEDGEIFSPGVGADISAYLRYGLLSNLDLNFIAGVGYVYSPLQVETSVSTFSVAAGAGISWEFVSRFRLGAYIKAGYFFSMLNDYSIVHELSEVVESKDQSGGGNPFFAGGINFSYRLSPSISLGLDASYRSNVEFSRSIVLGIDAIYHFPKRRQPVEQIPPLEGLDLYKSEIEPLFPVFFKLYDESPVGTATLRNTEEHTIEDIRVSFYVEEYMVDPKSCPAPQKLRPGEEVEVELFGLFTDEVLEISESTKVSAKISVESTMKGKRHKNEFVDSIRLYDRNALTWEDDRRAAAFVTMKDPTVLRFAKTVASAVKDKVRGSINANLLMGLALHEALDLYGIAYVVDPSTPYRELSERKQAVDYLQFPKQSLAYKAGDCDDLSILYSALLESVGVETAFITIPGHIFMALSLDTEPSEAAKQFRMRENLIFRNDKTWLPVEITLRDKGFLEAWETAAAEWHEHERSGKADFYPIHEAWQLYEPVGFTEETVPISLPEEKNIVTAYLREVETFIQREITPAVDELKQIIEKTDSVVARNRLGVLYGRYGLFESAEEEFRKILSEEQYLPTIINMGNLYFLQSQYDRALNFFERAKEKAPERPIVLLCLARVNHAMENYGIATRAYNSLKKIDPTLARRFSYLELKGEAAKRSAEAGRIERVVLWEEGEE